MRGGAICSEGPIPEVARVDKPVKAKTSRRFEHEPIRHTGSADGLARIQIAVPDAMQSCFERQRAAYLAAPEPNPRPARGRPEQVCADAQGASRKL